MFALRSGQGRKAGTAGLSRFGLSMAAERFVLPRFLRRAARLFWRFAGSEPELPRFVTTIGAAGFIAAAGLYGALAGGHVPALVQFVTSNAGFAIETIDVTGNRETSEIDILDRLHLDGSTSLLGFNASAARERIAKLPWVRSVAVRKIYPDRVEIILKERQPFAIWQSGSQLSLIERSGDVIVPFNNEKYATLPLVTGFGAAAQAADFIFSVAKYPELAGRVKGYIRVADRRWNMQLENGVTVKLPERGIEVAISELITLDRNHGLLSRDIKSVDMRLVDRLVIGLTPEAATRRNANLKDRLKQKRRPEKHI